MYKLDEILDLEKWQSLQDSLAKATGLSIITTDYKGNAITKHSACTPFCQTVRESPELLKRCQKCDSRAGLEAVCNNAPFIYLCHYNIVDIAIPISIEDKYAGAVLAGQVRLTPSDNAPTLEVIRPSPTSAAAFQNSAELQKLYWQLPKLSYNKIQIISNMLFSLCNYIVGESKSKNILHEMYAKLLSERNNDKLLVTDSLSVLNSSDALTLEPFINISLNDNITTFPNPKNQRLIPVFKYLHVQKEKLLTLTDAAKLCNFSPNHLSRVFKKETGRNFSDYVNLLKVEWAKQLLAKTDFTVTQISEKLGFSDPSYFIKIFKKFEQVTPFEYRKYIA